MPTSSLFSFNNLRRPAAVLCASALLCFGADTRAQSLDSEPIQTDRPDFVESSNVVGPGRVQVETSVAVESTRAGGGRDILKSTPTLLRIGTGPDWELRLETDGHVRQQAGGQAGVRGYADLSVGMKWHARDQSGVLPSLALLAHADLDSGSRALRGRGVRPSVRMVAEWALPAGLSLGVMPGFAWEKTDDGRRFYQGIWGMVIGKAWTERFRTFAEFAAPAIARSRYGATFSTYNAGAAFLLSDQCQIDVMVQRGATRNAPDHAWSVGLSQRF